MRRLDDKISFTVVERGNVMEWRTSNVNKSYKGIQYRLDRISVHTRKHYYQLMLGLAKLTR